MCSYFEKIGIRVHQIVDAGVKVGQFRWLEGLEVKSPSDTNLDLRRNCLLAICVVTTPFSVLSRTLNEEGWMDVVPVYDIVEQYRAVHPLSNGWRAVRLENYQHSAIEQALAYYSDDISRAHLLQFIGWRRYRTEIIFGDLIISNSERYFIKEVRELMNENEVFVDIGAHHGSVIDEFIRISRGNFKRIIAIEADRENYKLLVSELSKKGVLEKSIETLNVCLDDENREEKFFFGNAGYSSQLSILGQERVKTVTFDSLGICPTFIKIHLEGNELNVLIGSKETLCRCRPKIAVTVYHNDDGFYKTISWLNSTLVNYRYFFRNHCWHGTGAVIYALPM
jgi:FkbM family methyltransferase